MIKINEIEMLKLINNGDLNAVKSYIDNEIIMQLKTDVSDVQKKKAFVKLADKFKTEAISNSIAGAFTQNDYTCLCDGARSFRIKQPIENFGSIAKISDGVTPLNLVQIIPDTRDMKEINIDLKDLQLKYKEYKSLSAKEKKDIWKKMFVLKIDKIKKYI